jgi:hypothetical protein
MILGNWAKAWERCVLYSTAFKGGAINKKGKRALAQAKVWDAPCHFDSNPASSFSVSVATKSR